MTLTKTTEASQQSLWPTVVSLVTDADHPASAVAVSAAEPRAGLANVNMVYCPAVTLSRPLLLDPAELSSSTKKITSNTANYEGALHLELQICAGSSGNHGNSVFLP